MKCLEGEYCMCLETQTKVSVSRAGISFLTSFKVSWWVSIDREEKIHPLGSFNSASVQHRTGRGDTNRHAR